jgi:nucleotide-binding universal stress UspA family protein
MKVLLAVDVLGTKLDCVVFDAPRVLSHQEARAVNRDAVELFHSSVESSEHIDALDRRLDPKYTLHPIETSNGRPVDEILKVAANEHVDFIIMGSCGRGSICDMVLGSFAKKVSTHTALPVMIVR